MWKLKSYIERFSLLVAVAIVLIALLAQPYVVFALEDSNTPSQPLKVYSLADFQEGVARIYVANQDSSDPYEIAVEPIARFLPNFEVMMSLSPSYKALLYVTADDRQLHNAEIWKVSLSDGKKQLLAEFEDDLWVVPPIWSPSGEWIAYIRVAPTGKLKLWYMDAEGEQHYSPLTDVEFRSDTFYGNGNEIFRWSDDWHIQFPTAIDSTAKLVDIRSGDIQTTNITVKRQLMQIPVPAFSQNDPTWKNDVMQYCNLTIGSAGCALTSSAMTFKYYGANTNPRTLNNCLGSSACPIIWGTAASSCSDGQASFESRPNFSYATVESELNNGYPVIVWISDSACNADVYTHFVVATGGSGTSPGNYSINDPWDGSTNRTLAYYTDQGYYLCTLRLFHGSPPSSNCCGCGRAMLNTTESSLPTTIYSNPLLATVVSLPAPNTPSVSPAVIAATDIPVEGAIKGYPESFMENSPRCIVTSTTQIETSIEDIDANSEFIEYSEEVESISGKLDFVERLNKQITHMDSSQPASRNYYLARSVVGMSGRVKDSTNYRVLGTSGQSNGVMRLRSTKYTVNAGFWPGVMDERSFDVYLPLVLRSK